MIVKKGDRMLADAPRFTSANENNETRIPCFEKPGAPLYGPAHSSFLIGIRHEMTFCMCNLSSCTRVRRIWAGKVRNVCDDVVHAAEAQIVVTYLHYLLVHSVFATYIHRPSP